MVNTRIHKTTIFSVNISLYRPKTCQIYVENHIICRHKPVEWPSNSDCMVLPFLNGDILKTKPLTCYCQRPIEKLSKISKLCSMVVFLYCQPSKPSKPKTRFFIVSQISQVSQVSQNDSRLKLAYLAEVCHVMQCFDFTFCLFVVKLRFSSLNMTF